MIMFNDNISCEAIKATQAKCHFSTNNSSISFMCFIYRHQVLLVFSNSNDTNSTSQALEELNYTLAWPSRSRQVLQSHTHIQLAM